MFFGFVTCGTPPAKLPSTEVDVSPLPDDEVVGADVPGLLDEQAARVIDIIPAAASNRVRFNADFLIKA